MRRYIFPIIKKQKEDKQKSGVQIPLYKRAPMDVPPPVDKDEDNKGFDPEIIDFDIDGNVTEIKMRVY
tara:strand:+ start:224 stop:427 length:204 start_codon:yes stop_codon:yes gene_type:complete